MRNTIKYFYGIDIQEIKNIDGVYLFSNYMFKELINNIDFDLYNMMIQNNLNVHKIILNKNNSYITKFDNKEYVLYELCKNVRADFYFNKYSFRLNIKENKENIWIKLWETKIDYYENKILYYMDKCNLEFFAYYIGLAELAIRILKEYRLESEYSISHRRINNMYDFFCPDNFIIDYKVRDIAEYTKNVFFEKNITFTNVNDFFKKFNLSEVDYILLFARLIFPSYFFDCIENNQNIIKYTSKIIQYEHFLSEFQDYLVKKYNFSQIECIKK